MHLLLVANIVTTSKALVPSSDAPATSSEHCYYRFCVFPDFYYPFFVSHRRPVPHSLRRSTRPMQTLWAFSAVFLVDHANCLIIFCDLSFLFSSLVDSFSVVFSSFSSLSVSCHPQMTRRCELVVAHRDVRDVSDETCRIFGRRVLN